MKRLDGRVVAYAGDARWVRHGMKIRNAQMLCRPGIIVFSALVVS